jgi:hypothetical protein
MTDIAPFMLVILAPLDANRYPVLAFKSTSNGRHSDSVRDSLSGKVPKQIHVRLE